MIGIETEYGIWVEGKGAQDLVAEATYLVQGCPPPAISGRWDYTREHPRRDVRGFTVSQLSIDPTDAQFEQAGTPHSTDIEVRADRVLPSGARLYNDHGHPEFSTPECTSLKELIAHDRAGERWMQSLAERRSHKLGGAGVALYKNNTDFHGASYGTHESYLFARSIPFDDVIQALLPFFATRQIFAGAGKVGSENGAPKADFQLSQRADFFSTIASVDTLYNRPLINTRDEPHADARRFRRLHTICGDANFCEVATLLKCGSTLLILRLLEQGWRPEGVALADAVATVKQISHDQSFKWLAARAAGGTIGAVDVQRVYLSGAKEKLTGLSPETDLVLAEWETVLYALETDPLSLDGTLDWVTKRQLLDGFRQAEGLRWDDPHLQSLDLEYHNVDPGAGLYLALEQEGHVRRIIDEPEILTALKNPPPGSPRAIARGIAACRFPDAVKRVTWSRLTLEDSSGQSKNLSLGALGEADPSAVSAALRDVQTPAEFTAALEGFAPHADNSNPEED